MNKHALLTCSLFLLGACGPAPITSSSPQPTASPTAQPSVRPTVQPTPMPSLTPTPVPSINPTPTPTATPVPLPTLTPAPTPTPAPTTATLQAQVYDDEGRLRTNATVRVISNSPTIAYEKTMTLVSGRFELTDVPVNVSLEVQASDAGFTTRKQFVSLNPGQTRNLQFKGALFELSNSPEVIAVQPSGRPILATEPLKITFSENMDRRSVEEAFAIQAEDQNTAFLVDGTPIIYTESYFGDPTNVVFEAGQFNLTWDDGRTFVITPKISWPATTRSNFRVIFTYQPSPGVGGVIRDAGGTAARTPLDIQVNEDEDGNRIETSDGPFFLNNRNEPFLPITLDSNFSSAAGTVRSVSLNGNNPSGDSIRVRFSQPLALQLPNGSNLPADENAGALNASNYRLDCGSGVVDMSIAQARYVASDEVEVRVSPTDELFSSGDSCSVNISGVTGVTGQNFRSYNATIRVL